MRISTTERYPMSNTLLVFFPRFRFLFKMFFMLFIFPFSILSWFPFFVFFHVLHVSIFDVWQTRAICAMVRMAMCCGADATFAFERPCKRKPHLPRSGKLGPHTNLNRPSPSPPKIKSFGVHQKLTRQTPLPAVVTSGHVTSGQVMSCHVRSGTLTRAKAQEEKERNGRGRKSRIKVLGLKLSI